MPKYIERMKTEKTELDGKISRARKTIETPPFGSDVEGLRLLGLQITAMEEYSRILGKRIEYEGGKNGQ